ncbi:SNF2-related protein [Epilithonimonas pallida]|uniref:Helicase conserved C-terminal domain-containing protein n=1 Tax=Epilithonimonas pallida TaxID=373671 RepID=A0ABY1QWP6_9FLAO|nr:SNF2-related protein [Epilithonimonas pallida]SMP85824.1 Helicase conserved C-terminal domain-containing protein [Epilithonimonas pallida]
MFRFTYNNNFSFYFLSESGSKVPVSEWEKLQPEFLSQLAILTELHDNGLADYTNNSCEIESIDILRLSDIDKQILDLPNSYPFEIFVESDGTLTHNTFKFKYGFYDFAPNGTRLKTTRNGTILKLEENQYLLSENQYLLCQAIDEFNDLSDSEKGNVTNLKKLSELKSLSKESGLTLEQFLGNQELFIPNKIKLDVDFNNGLFEIIPTVEIENAIGFTNTFDKLPMIRDVYPVSGNNGETTRVVISKNQKTELQKIKQKRKIADRETIQEIIEHPELFFNDDDVDFTVFYSDRVKEIGVYSPKFYPFASPYKSQWIPGIVIKDKVLGEKKVYFKTPERLNDFIEQKEKAIKDKKQTVDWENVEIPINDAEKFIKSAKKQFENPNRPIKQDKKTDHEVLIIKENAELTEFIQSGELLNKFNLKYSAINNLSDGLELKKHQMRGVAWLQTLIKEKQPGGLLADDMGLGKTLQLLYFIEWHSQNYDDNKPYLIVAPVSLLENWENEYQKFFSPKNLPLCKLYGDVPLTKENNPVQNQKDARQLQFKQIILTNYETLRSYQISLGLLDFAIIAMDEAQKIKTPGTLITNASKALKADFKIAMTGTPVENTLVDIWCLMDFAVPGLLGNAKDFAKEYQNPLSDESVDIKSLTEKLRSNIGDFILRRYKKDVVDLPNKHDNEKSRIKREMPSIQLNRYKQEIEMANDSELEGVEKRNQKLKSLWAIRDISDHPYLLESQILKFSTEELISSSSKLQITVGILVDIKSKNEKVIVFADRRETQKMLQKVVYDTFGIFTSIINGDTPTTKQLEGKSKFSRQQTIDRFQLEEGFNVIIMSPIAAGVGLNVTKANHIIHYTRHWNPAKEEQATDRAYRIGQQKDVFVYYPMAIFPDNMKDDEGKRLKSFDEILDKLLNNKKALASNTLFPTEQAELTPDELFGNVFATKAESKSKPLSLADLDKLHPNLFEASIAALYKNQGFDVYLTPYSNDKGVDVVVLKNGENYLIQAKQTKSLVGNSAIQEICTAKKYYENKFKEEFNLITITNNDYTSSSTVLANSNNIKLINRKTLETLIIQNNITIQDISKIESQRMVRI